jgi:hypothetical protein
MAGIPEILIFLSVLVILGVFIAFVHSWLRKDSQETETADKRDRSSTEAEPGRREDGTAGRGYFGRSDCGAVGANR